MSLSLEEIQAAEQMHEFVCRFEKYGRRQILIRSSCLVLSVICSAHFITNSSTEGHFGPISHVLGWSMLGFTLGIFLVLFLWSRELKRRYENSREMLRVLERDHGDELRWVREARILDAAGEIEQELAKPARSS